jgi:hypothetical protein
MPQVTGVDDQFGPMLTSSEAHHDIPRHAAVGTIGVHAEVFAEIAGLRAAGICPSPCDPYSCGCAQGDDSVRMEYHKLYEPPG